MFEARPEHHDGCQGGHLRIAASAILLWSLLIATAAAGQTKPAWEWTDDERIAARTNPTLAAIRVGSASQGAPTGLQPADVIDGKRDSALFLPVELFESVVRHGFLDDGFREAFAHQIAASGLPADFWPRLERIADRYIDDLRDASERSAALQPTLCGDRAAALAAARAELGPALDRFMYAYVAPSRKDILGDLPDASRLTAMSQGCR